MPLAQASTASICSTESSFSTWWAFIDRLDGTLDVEEPALPRQKRRDGDLVGGVHRRRHRPRGPTGLERERQAPERLEVRFGEVQSAELW